MLEDSSRKRKGKEVPAGEPKKNKIAGPLPKVSEGPKMGGQANPLPTTPRRSPRPTTATGPTAPIRPTTPAGPTAPVRLAAPVESRPRCRLAQLRRHHHRPS